MINYRKTVISQYGNSSIIGQLLDDFNQYIDPQKDVDNFYNIAWNINTATGFGLDIWGRIVGVQRSVPVVSFNGNFGFNDGVKDFLGFNQAPFFNAIQIFNGTYVLSDDAFRSLIFFKALVNVSDTSAKSMNGLMQQMFAGRGRVYTNDLGGMQMRFTFEFPLQPYEVSILEASGATPKPVGVTALLFQRPATTFGFREAGDGMPFGQGTFLGTGVQIAI